MTDEDIKRNVDEAMQNRPRRHNLEPFRDSSRTRVLRFWLNVIFLVGAIAGLIVYFYADHDTAKWILYARGAITETMTTTWPSGFSSCRWCSSS